MNIWATRAVVAGLVIIFLAMVVLMGIILCGCASAPEREYGYQAFKTDHCELCGATENLEWAHAYPQSLAKGTALEYLIDCPTNGVTLCRGRAGVRGCHETVSHYGNTSKYWNPELIPTVERLKQMRREYK